MDKTIEKWKECAPGTLGSALFKTLDKWQDKVLYADTKHQTKRFVNWVLQMQDQGYFGQCTAGAPTRDVCAKCLDDSERELKRSRNFANGQKWPFKAIATRHAHKLEKFHLDTTCFVMELLKVLPTEFLQKKEGSDGSSDKIHDKEKQASGLYPSLTPSGLYPSLTPNTLQFPLHKGQSDLPSTSSESQELDTSPKNDLFVIKGGVVTADVLDATPQYVDQTKEYINSMVASNTSKDEALPKLARELRDHIQTHAGYRPREIRNNIHDCKDKSPSKAYQFPLTRAIGSRGNEVTTYSPFSLQDVTLIKQSLPALEKGGSLWINEFLRINCGADLGIGDFRRIFTACSNVTALRALEEKIRSIDLPDYDPLSSIVATLWPTMREIYPLKLNTSELYNLPLKTGEKGSVYLQRTRQYWEDHTGEDPSSDSSDSLALLYRGAVETSLPVPVRDALRKVVGLSAMDFTMWSTYVIHYIDMEEERSSQTLKNLADMKCQLIKTQLQNEKENAVRAKAEKQLTAMPAGSFNAGAQIRTFQGGREGFRNPNRSKNRFSNSDMCFQCGKRGHWKNECPQSASNDRGRFNNHQQPPFNPTPYTGPTGQQLAPPPPLNPFYDNGRQTASAGPHLAPAERQMP